MTNLTVKSIRIEEIYQHKNKVCREILEALPEWFGIPESIDEYVDGVENMPMLVAKDQSDNIIGFISLKIQTSSAVEAYVLGIRKEWHRKGCGNILFKAAENKAKDLGAKFLTVKTLADTNPDINYTATRRFYESFGFKPIEIFPSLWSPENPCLLMLKILKD